MSDSQHHRVCAFDAAGAFLFSWGAPGLGTPGLFAGPRGIAIDGAGDVYVADEGNSRVQKFDAQGRLLSVWDLNLDYWNTTPAPRGVFVDERDQVYVTDVRNSRIYIYSTSGLRLASWSTEDPAGAQWGANDLHVDRSGRIVVVGADCKVKLYARDLATPAQHVTWGTLKRRYR